MSYLKSSLDILRGYRATLFYHLDQSNAVSFKKLAAQIIQSYGTDVLLQTHDERNGFEGKTLLHQASRLGSNEIVRHLISLGHAVDVIDSSSSKTTPLMDAIAQDFIETCVILVECGARLELQDINNENVFHYAARYIFYMYSDSVSLYLTTSFFRSCFHQFLYFFPFLPYRLVCSLFFHYRRSINHSCSKTH